MCSSFYIFNKTQTHKRTNKDIHKISCFLFWSTFFYYYSTRDFVLNLVLHIFFTLFLLLLFRTSYRRVWISVVAHICAGVCCFNVVLPHRSLPIQCLHIHTHANAYVFVRMLSSLLWLSSFSYDFFSVVAFYVLQHHQHRPSYIVLFSCPVNNTLVFFMSIFLLLLPEGMRRICTH